MTDNAAFLNLVRGNRVPALMGLQQEGALKYGPQYHYIELPVGSVRKDDGTVIEDKVLRNQHVEIVAAGSIMVRGQSPVLVVYNNSLQQVANLGSMHLVHPGGERHSPSFWATFRKDCDISTINWSVRLYLLA